jgi:hypothetical protein
MKAFSVFALLFFGQIGFSQNIIEFFQMLPDSIVLNLGPSERSQIVAHSKNNKSFEEAYKVMNSTQDKYAFESVSKTYLKLIGSFEGQFQMKLWKLPKPYVLVGIYKESCGPVCVADQLGFYRYSPSNGFEELNLKNVFPLQKMKEFIFPKLPKNCSFEEDWMDFLLYQFSEKGKSIQVTWNNEAATTCAFDLNFELNLLTENLKNETYFGIKEK